MALDEEPASEENDDSDAAIVAIVSINIST